jgi:outer membrane lipoprotein-sorting protein
LLAVCLFALLAVMAGCGELSDDEGLPESDEIADTYESLDAYNATYVRNISTVDGETERATSEIVIRPGTSKRYQETPFSNGSTRTITVSNESATWNYDVVSQTVRRGLTTTTQRQERHRQARRVVARINDDDDSTTPAFPIIPFAPGIASSVQPDVSDLNISTTASYAGTRTVSGREAHVVTLGSTDDTQTAKTWEWTYYLDTERFVLLGTEFSLTTEDGQVEVSQRLRNITFNPDLPDGLFDFTPPADAEVTDLGSNIQRQRYESREQLADAADLQVPDPDVPAAFELDEARRELRLDTEDVVRARGDTEAVTLRYTSNLAILTVSKQNITVFDREPVGVQQAVEINNRSGIFTPLIGENRIQWQCPDTSQTVRGPLAQEQLVDIASSVEC